MAEPEHSTYDVVVIGAGPSGLAAAVEASVDGAAVALLDQQARVGGAYWRHSPAALVSDGAGRGPGAAPAQHDWATLRRLLPRLDRVDVRTEHTVWSLERARGAFVVRALRGERERRPVVIEAASVVVATGAYERVVPFTGWTLPGVMTAGGGQALLKGTRVAPGSRVALAGSGPLLLVVADALLRAGVDVVVVAESSHPSRYGLHPRGWAGAAARVREGAAYARTLTRCRVPYLAGHRILAAFGADRVARVAFVTGHGRVREYDVDTLLVSHGFTPQLELLLQCEPRTRVDADGSLVVAVDVAQRTSVPGLLATGEVTGVGGASLAILEGYVAGRTLSGRDIDPAVHGRIEVHRRFAHAMHQVHSVDGAAIASLADDEVLCRCEEVSAGTVRRAVRELGVDDVRGAKLMTRAGMGLCQGRMCQRAVRDLVALESGRVPDDDSGRRATHRLPAFPVPLGALSGGSALDDAGRPRGLGSAHGSEEDS